MPVNKKTEEILPPEQSFELNMNLSPGYYRSSYYGGGAWRGDVQTGTIMGFNGMIGDYRGWGGSLKSACWWAYNTNGILQNAINFRVSLPTLDRTIQTKDKKRNGLDNPTTFDKNKRKYSAILDLIRDKVVIRDALLKVCNDGMAVYYFNTNVKYSKEKYVDPYYFGLGYELFSFDKSIKDKKLDELTETELNQFLGRIDNYATNFIEYVGNKNKRPTMAKKLDKGLYNYLEANAKDAQILTESNMVNIGVKNCALLPLNIDYVQIVGQQNSSHRVAFNLMYFETHTVYDMVERLMAYPREIINAWRQWKAGNARSNWFVLPIENTIVVKTGTIGSNYIMPITAGALDTVDYYNQFMRTKRNYMRNRINKNFMWQEFPKKDNTTNVSLLTQDQQQHQHETAKNAATKPNDSDEFMVSFISVAPGTNFKDITFDTSLFDEKNESALPEKIAGSVGVGLGLITGNSGNYASLKLNLDILMAEMHKYVEQFQDDLNKVVNANILKDDKCYVEVSYGYDSYIERAETVKNALDLYKTASAPLELVASAMGYDIDGLLSMMSREKELDIEGNFPPHVTQATQQTRDINMNKAEDLVIEENPNGRPRLNDNEVTDAKTIATRASDGNNTPRANV